MSVGSIYGPHVINGAGPHLADLRRLQPRLALVLDPNADDVRALRAVCPQTTIVGRIYAPDSEVEARIRANPESAAQWAHDLVLAQSAYATGAVNYWQIANEILQFWDGMPLLSRFEVARMRLAQGRYGCGILAFSVGQPDLPEADRLALWRQVYPALTAAEAGGHVVVLHQYGAPDLWGPAVKGGAPWLVNRLEQQVLPLLPYQQVKFAVCEYGIDGLLLDESVRSVDQATAAPPLGEGVQTAAKDLSGAEVRSFSGPAGWQRYTDAAGYVKQLTDMGSYLAGFSDRIIGYALFTLGHNAPWQSYDIAGEVLRRLADYYVANPNPPPPVTPPTLPQRLQAAFGAQFSDLRTTLPHGPTPYAKRPLSAITRVILHHTATAQSTTWEPVARYHVTSLGWPGIGYHVGIHADGRVALLNDPETISYHAGTANSNSVALCVVGNYQTDAVSAALWQRILAVKAVLDTYIGRTLPMIGHRDAPDNATVCPGTNLYAKLNATPEDPPMTIKLGSYVDDFNLKIVPFEQRPDKAHWTTGPFYRIVQVFTTRDGSWGPSTNLGSIDQWARDAWHSGADWKGAGGTNNFFFKVLDKAGKVVPGKGLYFWQGPMTDDPSKLTNVNQKTTWDDGTENLPVWDYYDPSKGETGKWGGATIGRSDVLMGVDLPYKNHVSTFVVLQETDATDPGGPLPEKEPILPVGTLADKCRWWLEESIRQDEAGNRARAEAIRYSLIKLNGGLFYRLENALKASNPTG